MTRYVAFLRGVNVGGVNLKMADVAGVFTDAGFTGVATVLASGNVLLESGTDAADVRATAERSLREAFGYDAWVLVYKLDTVAAIAQDPTAGLELNDDGVLVFDVETTGTDKKRDQVIELCVQFGLGRPGAPARSRTWRFLPQVPISPGAQAVHGISMDDLASCPPFAACADEIAAMFAEAKVLVGYNLMFDMDMIQAEYERLRRPPVDFSGKTIVDPFRLWQQCEPRSLQHAHQRFVGAAFAAAHSASADVAATGRVLTGMLRTFGLVEHGWDAIAAKCDPQHAARASWLGPSRHLRWDGDVVVLGFGKHANAPLHQLAGSPDRGFLRWVIDRDFPIHVGEICRAALELPGEAFLAWARARYPAPAAPAAGPGATA